MSQPPKKSRPPEAGAPRSLGEVYRAKKHSAAPRQRGSPVPWIVGALIVAAGIAALAKFRPGGAKADGGTNATARMPAQVLTGTTATASAPKPPAFPPGQAPRIAFGSTTYDFGRANGDDQVDCTFSYTNAGNFPLTLSEVAPGCGCMKLQDATRQLAPGQSGAIKVRLDTRHYTGPFAKSVFVTCDDPANPRPILEVRGYVFRPVEVKPEFAVINLTAETPSNAAMVRILNHADTPLELSPPVCSEPALAVELRTNQLGKDFQLVVSTPPPFPSNALRGNISIRTSATNRPVLNIVASVNHMPLVSAFPNAIQLPAPPYTSAVPYTVFLRNNSTGALRLTDLAVNAPGVTVQLKEEQAGAQFAAVLTFPADFNAKPNEPLELTAKSNLPLLPLVKVPIIVSPPVLANPPAFPRP